MVGSWQCPRCEQKCNHLSWQWKSRELWEVFWCGVLVMWCPFIQKKSISQGRVKKGNPRHMEWQKAHGHFVLWGTKSLLGHWYPGKTECKWRWIYQPHLNPRLCKTSECFQSQSIHRGLFCCFFAMAIMYSLTADGTASVVYVPQITVVPEGRDC